MVQQTLGDSHCLYQQTNCHNSIVVSIPAGPVFSVVTPFTADGHIDYPALERYIEALYEQGARVFYAMAFNSRYPQMRLEEIVGINDRVCRITKGLDADCIAIVGDPVACSTDVSGEVAHEAARSGADLFSSIFGERYYSDAQVVAHYKTLSQQSPIPLLIHQMPLVSGYGGHLTNWLPSTLESVLTLKGVVAMKEDSKDRSVTSFVLRNFASSHSIILSGGGKRQFLQHLDDGAQHWLNGVGVFAPRVSLVFSQALKSGDQALIRMIIEEVEAPFFDESVAKYGWHLAMRSAIEHAGYFPRFERLPLVPLNAQQHEDVGRVVRALPLSQLG